MIDPILSLSFTIHSDRGIYALLLGSGVSRAAEIPTGWEVVVDLVRKLAHLQHEDPEPDPVAWYEEKYGGTPDYSDLLDQLAKTPAERNQLLRAYFEPSEDERERGVKVPTEAHRAIARLVADGFVRVIVTTNFDRLLEKALETAGVTPTVMSTPAAVEGTLPLQHNRCSIIKLHGDYLDTSIKNTPEELADYDETTNRLLDRIFDEYGLIICGWSADYDTALRAALERCKSHRFTTYWASRDDLGEAAQKLVNLRRAQVIPISDAETFFTDLAEKVSALEEYSRPHPLSSKLAIATVKKHLTDQNRIRLYDLVMGEAGKVRERLVQENLLTREAPWIGPEQVVEKTRLCESLSEVLLSMIVTGCYWGESQHEYLWARSLEMLATIPGEEHHISRPHFGLYPALLLLYAGGLAAVAAERYGTLSALLTTAKIRQAYDEKPSVLVLYPGAIMSSSVAKHLTDMWLNYHTPTANHLNAVLREPLNEFLPQNTRYDRCFDRLEYIMALVHADLHEKQKGRFWAPIGRFGWREREDYENHISKGIEAEISTMGNDWPPLKVGLFNASADRARSVKSYLDQRVAELEWPY